MTVRKFADLSTAHLTEDSANNLFAGLLSPTIYPHPEGIAGWIYVPGESAEDDSPWMQACPADLRACITHARQQGCDYILFDRDAEPIDDLPTYEW